jgi:hypothetical protein
MGQPTNEQLAIVIPNGAFFDEQRRFIHVPVSGLGQMTEVFGRRLIWLLVEKDLLSGRLTGVKSRESPADYIPQPPLWREKIRYEPFEGRCCSTRSTRTTSRKPCP